MANNKKELEKYKEKERLTPKNMKFIGYLAKGMKITDAHRLAGYSGQAQAGYALKNKLKSQLAKVFEGEGISREKYWGDLLELLRLPCVDPKTGQKLESLSFNQYLEVRKLLRDELPSNNVTRPSITAFVIQRYGDSDKVSQAKPIDITPIKTESES